MQFLLDKFEHYVQLIPIELFVLGGSFVEEVVAPIPSPFVMGLAGSAASAQGYPFWYLFVLSLLAATGKTLGGLLLYWLADKAEDIVMSKIGRYIGITHKEVERLGERLNSGTWRDWAIMLAIRSTPVIASAPVSLICGFIKVPIKLFAVTTFFGTIIRDFVYLYVGYTTLGAANTALDDLESFESIVQILMAISGLIVVGWIIYKRKFAPKD